MLAALPGYALVKLPKKYESGLTQDKDKYETNTKGTLVDFSLIQSDFPEMDLLEVAVAYKVCVDKTVHFDKFKDGDIIRDEDEEFVFVPVTQLRGVEYAEEKSN